MFELLFVFIDEGGCGRFIFLLTLLSILLKVSVCKFGGGRGGGGGGRFKVVWVSVLNVGGGGGGGRLGKSIVFLF